MQSNHIYFLSTEQQIGWIKIRLKMERELKSIWKEVHSLTFESGNEGYFYFENVIFHFCINQNNISYSITGISSTPDLIVKFKEVFNALLPIDKKERVCPRCKGKKVDPHHFQDECQRCGGIGKVYEDESKWTPPQFVD